MMTSFSFLLMQLKNEIAELTQQRDFLQSKVEDLRRLIEDYGHSAV